MEISAFTDADCGADRDGRKSTSGYCMFLAGNLVSWSSKKQNVVSTSSTEAEYRSLSNGAAKLTWLQSLLAEMNIKLEKRPILWCDNKSAIALAENPVFYGRTKHIEIDVHFVRNKISNREFDLKYVESKNQVADIMTKALLNRSFEYLRSKLNVLADD